jgi:hypothetical protein
MDNEEDIKFTRKIMSLANNNIIERRNASDINAFFGCDKVKDISMCNNLRRNIDKKISINEKSKENDTTAGM